MILNINLIKDNIKHEYIIHTNRKKLIESFVNQIKWRVGTALNIDSNLIEKQDNEQFKQKMIKYNNIKRFDNHPTMPYHITISSDNATKTIVHDEKTKIHEITIK